MSFKTIDIQACYESGVNDIVEEFYVPVLSEACRYDRIAGFFSSATLSVAARGLAEFIRHNGKMRLITSPILDPDDFDIIQKIVNGDVTLQELGINLGNISESFQINHIKALGWMLENGLLEIKLAIVTGDDGGLLDAKTLMGMGLFHQKVGVMTDREGNKLSFSGSINETAAAWINNDEEFKVFKQWDGNESYLEKDIARFDNLWNGKKKFVSIYDLPTAIKSELIKYSRKFDVSSISLEKYIQTKKKANPFEHCGISLFFYQKDALNQWRKNGYSMLFEMATGTGKTRTAIAGLKHIFDENERVVAIISCPQNTLARQWEGEIAALHVTADISKIIDGTNPKWKQSLEESLAINGSGFADKCIIFTTHATCSSEKFTSLMLSKYSTRTKYLFIGDEAHWLGAPKLQKALLPIYDYRIGLSATPSRWFDDKGTRLLEEYFGNNHFEFTIKDALTKVNPLTGKHFLVNYYYKIRKIGLTEDEGIEYSILTDKIAKLFVMKDSDPEVEEKYNRLLEKRADIIKNASNKLEVFEDILTQLESDRQLENLIIFVSPQQREQVLEILRHRGIISHQLTQEEGTKLESRFGGLSERQHIINLFRKGFYKALVAIKCLDEGIDIPSASRGILLSSSTNPREYVQRIGRIIRQDSSKSFAYLYDICVDSTECLSGESLDIEERIRNIERKRLQEIARNAINSAEALNNIF